MLAIESKDVPTNFMEKVNCLVMWSYFVLLECNPFVIFLDVRDA